MNALKKGFTLIEVNLAIFVMATGVLAMCGLYSLGYRENSQSIEDVDSTAYADVCLAPLVAALSSPLLTWEDWQKIGDTSGLSNDAKNLGIDGIWPANGWEAYIQVQRSGDSNVMRVIKNPRGEAAGAYGKLKGVLNSAKVNIPGFEIPSNYQAGLVITRRGSVVQIAYRLSRRSQALFSQPVIVAEVAFQGGFKKESVEKGFN